MNLIKKTTILSIIFIFSPTLVNANPLKSSTIELNLKQVAKAETTKKFITNFKPPNKDKPQHTVGGATRGDTCAIEQEDAKEITLLVPAKEQSLTLQSHPSLFAYVSPMKENKSAILIIKDETEDYYYSQKLIIPATGGVIKMTLAEDAPPLEIGESYTWFLRIQCNTYLEPEDPQISASITRIEGNIPSLNQEDLILFYTNSQIWYDSLNTAFALSESGKDIYWSQLLNSIGMKK